MALQELQLVDTSMPHQHESTTTPAETPANTTPEATPTPADTPEAPTGLDSLKSYSEELGLEFDEKAYEGKELSEDFLRQESHRMAAKAHASFDPELQSLLENRVPISAYLQERLEIERLANTDPKELAQRELYVKHYNDKLAQGLLKADATNPNQISKESQELLVKLTTQEAASLGEAFLKQRGESLQQHYKGQVNALPAHIAEQQQKAYAAQVETYKTQVDEYAKDIDTNFTKYNKDYKLPDVGISKEDFVAHVKKNLTPDDKGQVPFYSRLENDPKFAYEMQLVSLMLDKGLISKLDKAMLTKAWNGMGLNPKASGGASGPTQGSGMVDTSKPHKHQ